MMFGISPAMTLNRFCRSNGHRIFREYTWPADLKDFDRFNLIYGWNGSGKTTLGKLFRSLERRIPVTEGTVIYRIDGDDVDGALLATRTEHVRVFNQAFVT